MARPNLNRPATALRPIGQLADGRPKFATAGRKVWLMLLGSSGASADVGGQAVPYEDIRCIMRNGEVGLGWRIEFDGQSYQVERVSPARQWNARAFSEIGLRLIRSVQ